MSVLKYYRIAFSKNPSKILRRVFECIICLVSRRFTAKCIQLPYTTFSGQDPDQALFIYNWFRESILTVKRVCMRAVF